MVSAIGKEKIRADPGRSIAAGKEGQGEVGNNWSVLSDRICPLFHGVILVDCGGERW